MEVVRGRCADCLVRYHADMSDKQAAVFIAIESLGQRSSYLDKALGTGLSLQACRRSDDMAQCAYENILGLAGAVEAQSFLQEGCSDDRLTGYRTNKSKHAFLRRREG